MHAHDRGLGLGLSGAWRRGTVAQTCPLIPSQGTLRMASATPTAAVVGGGPVACSSGLLPLVVEPAGEENVPTGSAQWIGQSVAVGGQQSACLSIIAQCAGIALNPHHREG